MGQTSTHKENGPFAFPLSGFLGVARGFLLGGASDPLLALPGVGGGWGHFFVSGLYLHAQGPDSSPTPSSGERLDLRNDR